MDQQLFNIALQAIVDTAKQAYEEAESAAEASEIMARYDVDDYYLN